MWVRESRPPIPKSHPIHRLFGNLTARGLRVVGRSDRELVQYLSDMLVRFVHIESLYRIRDERGVPVELLTEMMEEAAGMETARRRDAFRHSGDFALFVLGFYPERLLSRRAFLSPEDFAQWGRRAYRQAAEMEGPEPPARLLRRLSAEFESCAVGLHWVREYTHDPFYQYMLRQFEDEAMGLGTDG